MNSKSKPILWLEILIAAVAIAWFSYDFFHTLFNGLTYTLRFDDQISFKENRIAFFIAVAIKIGVFYFFVWLLRGCIKRLNS